MIVVKKKYDVLILFLFFYPDPVTAARLSYQMAQDLVKKGLKVRVLCGMSKKGEATKAETINGIDIRRLTYIQLPKTSKIGRLINYFSFILAVIVNWPRLTSNKCTIVYSDPPILPLIASVNKSLFKNKYIFVCNDIYPDIALTLGQIKKNSFIHNVMNKVNKRVDNNVDRIIALSHDMKNYILKTRQKIADHQITVIPNWYDNHGTNVLEVVKDSALAELKQMYSMIILYSGNMGIAQDVQTIIETAKALKDQKEVLFIFTGNGKKGEYVESEIKNHQLNNIRLYGFLTGVNHIDMLKIADVHVISLVKGVEGMAVPSKTYSYMSIGRPLIAIMDEETDIAKDINRHDLGCVLKSGDIKKFSDYIMYLLNNKQEIAEIGKRVRHVFNNNYTREISTTKYYEVVKEIIADAPFR